MKNILLIIFLLSIKGYSQKLVRDEVSGMYKLDTILNTTLSKEAMYHNALGWIASKNRDANTEIISKNEENGEILFTASSQRYVVEEEKIRKKTIKRYDVVTVYFKGKVVVKDNKYRLIFSDIEKKFIAGIRIPLVPSMIDDGKLDSVEAFKDLKMYQNSFIRSMDKKPDNDF